jgi:hypothetical protein
VHFTLTYQGRLKPSGRAPQVQAIREALHPQLVDLWSREPLADAFGSSGWLGGISVDVAVGGQHFRPIVHDNLKLTAEVDVLMLRPGRAGAVVQERGDIDNRLKTLFDALSAPATAQQVQPSNIGCSATDPTHVLLQDDRLITGVTVRADRWLGRVDPDEVFLVIGVRLKATSLIWANLALVSG